MEGAVYRVAAEFPSLFHRVSQKTQRRNAPTLGDVLVVETNAVADEQSLAAQVEVTENGEPRDVSLRFLQFCFSVPPVDARANQRRSP